MSPHVQPIFHGGSSTRCPRCKSYSRLFNSLAGNPPLALLLHPVLEHPVAVEHYALVAGGTDDCDLNTLNTILKML